MNFYGFFSYFVQTCENVKHGETCENVKRTKYKNTKENEIKEIKFQ